jgi:hypothetical protein
MVNAAVRLYVDGIAKGYEGRALAHTVYEGT